jgi:hypothetical protein
VRFFRAPLHRIRLELDRDIFILGCLLIGWHDEAINGRYISLGIDGDKWIFKPSKNGGVLHPLLPAQDIINKYAEHPICMNENRLLPYPIQSK